MSVPTLATLLKAASIWLILALSHVGECHGSGLPDKRSRLGHRGKFDGQLNTLKGRRLSRVLLATPEADSPFSPFTPFTPFTPFSPMTSPPSPIDSFPPPISPSISPPSPIDSFPPPISPSSSPPSPINTVPPPISPSSSPPSPISTVPPPISPSSSPPSPISTVSPSISPSTSPPSPTTTSNPPTTSPISPSSPPPNTSVPPRPSGLQVGFYKGQCPNNNVDVEATITTKVQELFGKDATLLPALLRMQFHDCFVNGCDASILIDGPTSEKTAGPNLSVRGYEFINTLKSVAEAECPDVVSCADIMAIATKELIKLGGGPGYSVQTGRKDGLVSNGDDVNLPSPFATVTESILAFGNKNFSPEEMVLLIGGGHTIGKSHCSFFQDRLYEGTSQFDPNMDSNLREQLSGTCPEGTNSDNFTFLDQNPLSSSNFDNSFLNQLLNGRGILPIDQALSRDSQTSSIVLRFAQNAALFNAKFASVMIKLQALDVLLGDEGQIRKVCSKIN